VRKDQIAEKRGVRRGATISGWRMIAGALIAAAGLWYWAVAIYAPGNAVQVQISGRPTGNNSDLYARWYGTRELLVRGRDPYSMEITREIQMGFYGRPLDPKNKNDPKQQEGFAYPLYVAFLMAALAQLPFPVAQEISRWLLLLAIAVSVPLWSSAVGTRINVAALVAAMVLAVGSYPAVMEFYQQNLAALIVFLLAAAAACLARGWLIVAGFLLALATVKPEISGLIIAWLLCWSLCRIRERGRLVLSFVISLAVLIFCTELYLPHWPTHFLEALRAYAATETDPSILQAIFTGWVALVVSVGLLVAVAFRAWRTRTSKAGSEQFGWTLALVSSCTVVLIPKIAAYNQLVLIPALLLLVAKWAGRRSFGLLARSAVKATFTCQLWQWAAAVVLATASWLVPMHIVQRAAGFPLATLLAIPAVTALAVLLLTFMSSNTNRL